MEFTKAHGTGNDFVVLDDRADLLRLTPALVRALCHRRLGIGADGVLRIAPGGDGAAVTMDYRNRDGSAVEMCGNGLRVVAKYVVDRGLVAGPDDAVVVGTPAGNRRVTVRRGAHGRVVEATVDMGLPRWHPSAVPFQADGDEAVGERIRLDGGEVAVTAVSMGNPHAVLVVDDVASAPVATLGPALEHHPRFPQRANVSFAEVVSRRKVRLRVWERGVGETSACGSAACAVLVALQRLGRVGREAEMHLPGGVLRVRREDEGPVLLTGGVVEVATGNLHTDFLETAEGKATGRT